MTAVLDITIPGARPRYVEPPCPPLETALLSLLVERTAETVSRPCSGAERVSRIARLESLKNAVEALQSAETYAFAREHAVEATAAGVVEPEKLERSIAGQIALACRVSPTEGRKRVRVARDLRCGLDHVRGLFDTGEISGYKAATVVSATSHLDAAERAEVDRRLSGHQPERLGVGRIRNLARSITAQVAPEKFLARCTAARTDRRVSLRPAANGMVDLIAHLPVEQGVACYASLAKAVNDAAVGAGPVIRGRGQTMADTLVERITGQATAAAVPVTVQVVVAAETLLDPDSPQPAEIPGYGPVPADLIATATAWRRLLTRDGIVIGGDSRQRNFTGYLADTIRARDGHRCAEPYCDAPIRHIDHIHRWADGGKTEFDNGRGLCEFHNHLRETSGWKVERTEYGVRTTTPTGHAYIGTDMRRL